VDPNFLIGDQLFW